MKILFIENMYRTYFWEAISKKLEQNGFQTAWIVQNHFFAPNANEIIKVPYPKRKQLKKCDSQNKVFSFIKSTDRIINYFDGADTHYSYYYQEFTEALDLINPDLVIGESTLFHELMIIDICKKRSIPYLHPSSSSYPPRRFSFYQNDSKFPLSGEQHIFNAKEYDEYIDSISNRKVVPDYMKKELAVNSNNLFPKHKSFKDKINRITAYIKGEKFNTPSPLRKLREDNKVQQLLERWDKISVEVTNLPQNHKIILYPLQMQPEANLDVWGNTYRDQASLIQKFAEVIPSDWIVVVKTNPKSKYEMTLELLNVIQKKENVIALDRKISMEKIFSQSDLIATVTGTIAIEAVLSNKPLALFGPSIVGKTNGSFKINEFQDLSELIKNIERDALTLASQEDKRDLMHKMITSSYSGVVSDPMSNPNCINEDNLLLVEEAFLDVMERIRTYEN